jgi:entericidin B
MPTHLAVAEDGGSEKHRRLDLMHARYFSALLALLAALALGPALSACNTIAGAGEDISAGGQAIEGAAEKTQNSM